MASLATRLSDLATRIATECKAIRTLINGNAADLSALTTTAKTNLVAAINELDAAIDGIDLTDLINDAAGAGDEITWSIDKIAAELTAAKAAVKAEILGGASAAYDTLVELQALLEGDAASIATINTALGNRVRTDTAAQGLTGPQQSNARTNIAAVGSADVGNTDANLVTVFEAGLA
jgi:hypothetical protein